MQGIEVPHLSVRALEFVLQPGDVLLQLVLHALAVKRVQQGCHLRARPDNRDLGCTRLKSQWLLNAPDSPGAWRAGGGTWLWTSRTSSNGVSRSTPVRACRKVRSFSSTPRGPAASAARWAAPRAAGPSRRRRARPRCLPPGLAPASRRPAAHSPRGATPRAPAARIPPGAVAGPRHPGGPDGGPSGWPGRRTPRSQRRGMVAAGNGGGGGRVAGAGGAGAGRGRGRGGGVLGSTGEGSVLPSTPQWGGVAEATGAGDWRGGDSGAVPGRRHPAACPPRAPPPLCYPRAGWGPPGTHLPLVGCDDRLSCVVWGSTSLVLCGVVCGSTCF